MIEKVSGHGMRCEGPIYRPPSEADSLLVQATVGCPHNKCAFCMVYKKGPPFRVRPVQDKKQDLDEARGLYGPQIRTFFFPAGNTIAMPTDLIRLRQAGLTRIHVGLESGDDKVLERIKKGTDSRELKITPLH